MGEVPDMRAVAQSAKSESVDVLIVGAGISGVAAAYHLTQQAPDRTFVMLEAKESFGGTWLTHIYPGIRSDSDLYTFGYRFKPWTGAPIAGGEQIRRYMGSVIEEADLGHCIRYGYRVERACWSSSDKIWTLEARRADTGEIVCFSARFLWMCQGYYRHDKGYTPDWPGMDAYQGRVIHPQSWPKGLSLTDKQVVVIGSGATAATLIPNIADECQHVTMLQRSPTYFAYGKNGNDLADTLRTLEIDEHWIHEIVRRQILSQDEHFTRRAIDEPEAVRQELLGEVSRLVGPEVTEKHFSPRYRPWRQRLAFLPEADLFRAIQAGKASVETDEIERFTEKGLLLKSGKFLNADIVVTATGFELCVMGDIDFVVDGQPLDFAATVSYRGMMFTGVPNLAYVFGYLRASWTLRADLVGDFVCRLLNHMRARRVKKVEVVLRPEDATLPRLPWIDPENFNPGYLMRSMHLLPRRLDKPEWQHSQDYSSDQKSFPAINLDASEFVYDDRRAAAYIPAVAITTPVDTEAL
jgi:cation diffusion facilitator CzcD-associated flavoprotein CzcO